MALPVSAAVAMPETSTTLAAGSETPEPEARFEEAAFAEAARTGQRVEILDRREEKAEFFANPDGTTTRRTYGTPKWTRFEGMWRKTDPTLVKNAAGSLAPSAPAFPIAFSGGGTQPLATMVKKGKKLALTWPAALPEPVVEGDTATYRSVLPDVDLKLTANVDGFAQHLIINSAEAAANPALRSIELGVQTDGVTLSETADNQLLAKDDAGETIFSAPGPKMWEQPEVAPEEQTNTAVESAAMAADTVAEAGHPDSAPVVADVTDSTLTLTPDADLLASADQFPLVIDPIFEGGSREKWAVVYSATPEASYPNGSGWNSSNPADEPRVGFNGTGATRSFFAMNTNGLEGADIFGARFAVNMTHGYGCDDAAAGPTELWSTGSITDDITWDNNGPLWAAKLASDSYTRNATFCPQKDAGHDYESTALTNYVRQAAANRWGTLAFGLRAASGYEYKDDSYKRFRNNPVLEVDYNFQATVDASAAYEGHYVESGDGNKPVPCGGVIGNSGIALTAKVSDGDGGLIDAVFTVKNAAGTTIPFPSSTGKAKVASGQWAMVEMPAGNHLPNGTYTWYAEARDYEGPVTPHGTAGCRFTVDGEASDKLVDVWDDNASPEAGGDTDKYQARKPLQLRFTHDTLDTVGYCWTMDRPISVASTRCSNGNWVNAGTDPKNTATVTVTPSMAPSSTLRVLAFDAAGNHSPHNAQYTINDKLKSDSVPLLTTKSEFVYEPGITPATPNTPAHDRRGDLTGDGYADFVATDTDGKLRLYKGNGTTNSPAPGVTVGTSGWGGALIAHRGDLQGTASPTASPDGYEDFLVRLSNNRLYLYPSTGLGTPWYYARQELPHPSESQRHLWAGLRQIVMPGNIDGKPGNDLITLECVWEDADVLTDKLKCVNGNLVLYSGQVASGGGQDSTAPFDWAHPTTIGNGGWRDFTNLAVDDVNGDGVGDLLGRKPSDGKLYLYPGCLNKTNECPDGFKLGAPIPYGNSGWNQRPYLTSPGNIQGTVDSTSITTTDPDAVTIENPEGKITYNFKQFTPTAGEGYGDFWATTPADPDTPVQFMNEAGSWTSEVCPTGCLLTYPGTPTGHGLPRIAGRGAWGTVITGIF
ncbi:hypothetical protein ABZ958_37600 [Streptomyces sp. NPDC046237]|uniref:hypothetical protein n=1 Tax=Streptomyces sp. NPDC046237 TaxID=3154914 RepID=UPI0033DB561B